MAKDDIVDGIVGKGRDTRSEDIKRRDALLLELAGYDRAAAAGVDKAFDRGDAVRAELKRLGFAQRGGPKRTAVDPGSDTADLLRRLDEVTAERDAATARADAAEAATAAAPAPAADPAS